MSVADVAQLGRLVRVTLPLGTSAYGQRGLKAQPLGMLIRLGGEPLTGIRRSGLLAVDRGIEPSRPQV